MLLCFLNSLDGSSGSSGSLCGAACGSLSSSSCRTPAGGPEIGLARFGLFLLLANKPPNPFDSDLLRFSNGLSSSVSRSSSTSCSCDSSLLFPDLVLELGLDDEKRPDNPDPPLFFLAVFGLPLIGSVGFGSSISTGRLTTGSTSSSDVYLASSAVVDSLLSSSLV